MSTDDSSRQTAASSPEDAAEVDDTSADGAVIKPKRKNLPIWQETILLLGIALVLAIVIKAFFVQAFYIPSESMEPGLVKNDRILVQKVSYWFGGSPKRGDVVVFKDPDHWLGANVDTGPTTGLTKVMAKIGLYPSGGHLVKRVVGVEGDVIKCCDAEGRILVNGKPLEEDAYINTKEPTPCNGPMTGNCEWEAGPVPKGNIFVMGDNRAHSADSSFHLCLEDETDCTKNPYIDTDLVVGKVFVLVWPSDHFDWITRPADFDDIPAAK